MKRTMSVLLFSFLVLYPAIAQESLQPLWVLHNASPTGGGNAEAWGVAVASDGSIYWAVNRVGTGPLAGMDMALYRITPEGTEVWDKPTVYGGDFAQQIYNAVLYDTTLFLGGRNCRSNKPTLEDCDMLVASVSPATGNINWVTTWDGGYGYEEADGLAPVPDGLYVTGWADGDVSNWDAGVVKLNMQGELQWATRWGSEKDDHQDGHCVIDDTCIYGAGLYGGEPNPIIFLRGLNGQSMLARFSRADGSCLDYTTFGRDDPWTNFENALGLASDGTYLYVVGVTTVAENDNQIVLRKFDKSLNQLWERYWGGQGTEAARAIAVDEEGVIYVAGNTDSYGSGDLDVVLLKYSADGELLGERLWGEELEDNVLDLRVADRFAYLTGKRKRPEAANRFEAFLIKAELIPDGPSSGVRGAAAGAALGRIHPNPTGGRTFIDVVVEAPSLVSLRIHDRLGRIVGNPFRGELAPGHHSLVWNAGHLPSGVYLCTLSVEGRSETRPIMLIH